MSIYRWLAHDLRTNVALAELPLAVKSFGWTLNGIGQFNASLPVSRSTARVLDAATIPERTIVYVERDGVLLDGYVIWTRERSLGEPWALTGASILSILRRNPVRADLTYTAQDQFTIARGLINHYQGQPGGNIGIVTGSGTSGVTRDRTYYGYERKNLWDALAELAQVDNGFDFGVDVAWSAGTPVKNLTLSYPRRGRLAGTTGIVFESGKNLLGYRFLEDGTRSARTVDALGAGDGVDMLISTSTDTSLIDAGYPLTSEVVSHKDVTVKATLDAHAAAARRARAVTPTFLTLSVDPDDIDAGLGHWIVGDDARVSITDDNFPQQTDGTPGLFGYYRILAANVQVPEIGKETVEIIAGSIL